MRRYFTVLVLGVSLTTACVSFLKEESPVAPQSIVDDSTTVTLIDKENNQVVPLCTGYWVSDDLILSSVYCVKNCSIPTFWEESVYGNWNPIGSKITYVLKTDINKDNDIMIHRYAAVVATDPVNDFALIRAYSNTLPSHNIGKLFKFTNNTDKVVEFLNKNKQLFNYSTE